MSLIDENSIIGKYFKISDSNNDPVACCHVVETEIKDMEEDSKGRRLDILDESFPDGSGPIDPANYHYAAACATADDEFCENMNCPSVDHCRWSWPKDDPA